MFQAIHIRLYFEEPLVHPYIIVSCIMLGLDEYRTKNVCLYSTHLGEVLREILLAS